MIEILEISGNHDRRNHDRRQKAAALLMDILGTKLDPTLSGDYFDHMPADVILAATIGKELVGAAAGGDDGTYHNVFMLHEIAVVESQRLRHPGIGSMLLQEIEVRAFDGGSTRMRLFPRSESAEFFDKHGYTQSSGSSSERAKLLDDAV